MRVERVAELKFHEISRQRCYRLKSLLSEDDYDGNEEKKLRPSRC